MQVDNIAAFVDRSNIEGAVQLAYRTREMTVLLSYYPSHFEEAAGVIKFDQRPFIDLDEHR